MKNFLVHARMYILRGLLAVIPLLLCFLALELLYRLIDKQILKFLSQFFDIRQIPGLGILLLLICLYLIGLIFSNVVGRQIFRVIDSITERIPIIKFIYGIGKQISDTFSVVEPDRGAFKKAVFLDLFSGKGWTLGFITGSIKDANGDELFKVFVPTAPHPLTGIIFIVKPSQLLECGWSVEEAVKMIVSVGIISPVAVRKTTP